jgi:nucleoside-diphosphate kinase
MEQSLVLVKPDGVMRGQVGEIISRFERVGLKIVAMKMVLPERSQVDRHYALTEEWMRGVFDKAKKKFDAKGEKFEFSDHKAYGKFIKDGLVEFLLSGPVVAMVLEGRECVTLVRKLVGATEPMGSAPGTIRGDLSPDTYALSNEQKRPLRNLIHASGTVEEGKSEVAIWFTKKEMFQYETILENVLYNATYFMPKK